jgi:hypothetical protein
MVAGFISERWPASNQNPGRFHVGTPGRIKSESARVLAFTMSAIVALGVQAEAQTPCPEFLGLRNSANEA